MSFDNVIIHYMPNCPLIVKCLVNLRIGSKIKYRVVLKDLVAVNNWLDRSQYKDLPRRTIVHWEA